MKPKLGTLAAAWNRDAFERAAQHDREHAQPRPVVAVQDQEEDDDEDAFSLDDITATLACKMFRAFVDMVIMLGEVPAKLAEWSEQCPCHRHLQQREEHIFDS